MRSAMTSQQQAVRDQQSSQMANLDVALQGMSLTPEEQQDYIQQYKNAYELQLQQFKQQSELLENGQRRINRVCHQLHGQCLIVNITSADQ